MAEKIKEIKTRVALRTGDYAYWTTGAGKDIELYKGEVCICTIEPKGHPYDVDGKETGAAHTAPTVLFKVADANGKKFGDLKWVSGLAADVYDWAKAATKPTYAASEITGLDEYIAGEIQDTDTDTQYRFAVEDGALSVYKTVYTLGVAGTETKVGSYDFVTPGELTEILKNYYTKTEVDNLIQGVNDKIDGLDESVTTVTNGTGIAVTDGGTGNDHAYTVALDVNGAKTALGLDADGIAAYESVSVLNATAKSYADVVDEKIREDLSTGALEVREAQYAATAGKVQNALTVKVGGEDVVFDGSAAKIANVDAAIAAALEEEGHPEYSIAKVATTTGYSATYQLTKDGTAVGAKIDIPKDMVVSKGEVITYENAGAWGNAGTYIVLTLANATNDTLYIPANGLIEYVTSGSTADSQVIIDIDSNHKVTATIGAGKVGTTELATNAVVTAKIADKNVTEEKLEQDVQDALALARTALQEHQPLDNYKTKQTAVVDQALSGAKVVKGVAQDANGVISVSTRDLTPADIGAQPAGDYKTKQSVVNNKITGAASVLSSLTQDANGEISYETREIYGEDIKLTSDKVGANVEDVITAPTIKEAVEGLGSATINGKKIGKWRSTGEADLFDGGNAINLYGTDIAMSDTDATTVQSKIKALEDAKHISAVEADTGLKVVTGSTGSANKVAIDDEVVFVLNCNF